ncbi:hypothetical protein [Mycoplasma todarodis]|uniref:hypothetical protein n=1 Tax=Mycoplasma todarodis TaxID=1937191 RepID=UPI003B387389
MKNKKVLLSISTALLTATAPIVAVVSCGDKTTSKKPIKKDSNKGIKGAVKPKGKQVSEEDKLIKKYIETQNAEVQHYKKGEFLKGSGTFSTSSKLDKKSIKGKGKKKDRTFFVVVGMMFQENQKQFKNLDNKSLIENIEEIARIKVGNAKRKDVVFEFVKVQGKWHFAPSYIKKMAPKLTFQNDAYWAFDLSKIDKKYSDLLNYTKTILGKAQPAPATKTHKIY